MASELISGTETVGATEWSLSTDTSWSSADAQTTDGAYQLWLDLSALAAGDFFELRIYEKVLSSSTQRLVRRLVFNGATISEPIWASPALIMVHGWDFSLKKLSGTDRSIDWSIRAA